MADLANLAAAGTVFGQFVNCPCGGMTMTGLYVLLGGLMLAASLFGVLALLGQREERRARDKSAR